MHEGKTPDQYDYLKWDKPIDDASKNKIISQLKSIGIEAGETQKAFDAKRLTNGVRYNINGGLIYKALAYDLGSQKAASDFLLKAGIDGIDYPAGTLSGVKSDARNYVVFDPRAITINKVNGKSVGSSPLSTLALTGGVAGAGLVGGTSIQNLMKRRK